ncbi:MarR family winged helix-turn-helix transcriptional regulator [Actinocorallia sp. API 0066]|uniref:MarR family winged helix-turn-helix transcriptional regulator n=1 Tax=Actinocorallia sp. API 0066 TaxID=2896846 RepID=UPI001E38D07C|nr:MarR family winged helix-turn-helix transcriptional regulator [Actinocorallia sp. API 0066]MCD0449431.1 MarR family winged helix-turn-helix transcriptional regulator [Actinocorallia sp. API 0066]
MTIGERPQASHRPSTLGWTLTVLLRQWHERVEDIARELPQGVRGYQVLSAVAHGAPPTQAALAARLGIDRTVMTYLLDAFEGCDLLRRTPDPADRRARRIVPTDHGRGVLADLDARVAEAEDDLLRGLAAGERSLLLTLLERAASTASPDADPCTEVLPPRA